MGTTCAFARVCAWLIFFGFLFVTAESGLHASECKCGQHDAKASGPNACSRTESKSYCTIAFGASGNTQSKVSSALSSGAFGSAPISSGAELRPLLGNVEDPFDTASRLVSLAGRKEFDIYNRLSSFVKNPAETFTLALMLNFSYSAIELAPDPFLSAAKVYFGHDHRQTDDVIFKAFTTRGADAELPFGSGRLKVRFHCAVLSYSQYTSIVVSGDDVQGVCG